MNREESFRRTFFRLFGERVRRLREARNWTQEEMGEHGFSPRHVQQIEAGTPINVETALRISATFSMDLSRLFRGLEDEAGALQDMNVSERESRFRPRKRGRPAQKGGKRGGSKA